MVLEWIILAALTGVLALPLAVRFFQRRFDVFEPIVVFVVAWGTMFVVRGAAIILMEQYDYIRPTRSIPIEETLWEALLLALVGGAAFVAAYMSPIGVRLARLAPAPPRRYRSRTVIFWALLATAFAGTVSIGFLVVAGSQIGVSGLLLLVQGRTLALTRVVRSVPAYVSHASYLLTPAAIVLFAIGYARRDRWFLAASAVAAGLLVLLVAPKGGRIMLMPLIGSYVVYYYTTVRRRPGMLWIGLAATVAIIVSAAFLRVRNSEVRETVGLATAIGELASEPTKALAPITEGADNEMVAGLAAVLRYVPEVIPFQHGWAVFGDLLTRPIPRAWWAGKPRAPREQVIAALWPDEVSTEGVVVANPEFSVLFQFYMDFGIVSAALGMMLYGAAARGVHEYYRLYSWSTLARIVFALSVPLVVIAVRDGFVDTFVKIVFTFGPLLMLFSHAATRTRAVSWQGALGRVPSVAVRGSYAANRSWR